MHPMDVVGYTADADTYCYECAALLYDRRVDGVLRTVLLGNALDSEGNAVHAVFADDEWDTPRDCGRCDELLPVRLSPDGYVYVREALATKWGWRLEEWRALYGDVIGGGPLSDLLTDDEYAQVYGNDDGGVS